MKTGRTALAGVLLAGLALASPARADEWDAATDSDAGVSTDNALSSGSLQVHDLAGVAGVADQDWYLTTSAAFSSYEVVLDGMTSDLDLSEGDLVRLAADGLSTLQESRVDAAAGTRLLGWMVDGAAAPVSSFVRVAGAACGTACVATDRYRIRQHDTTYTIPRFNNSGTQATVLTIANASGRACSVTLAFLGEDGLLLHQTTRPVAAREVLVVPTAGLVPDESGSVRVLHTCGYGGLSGKAVAVEPATGFTFDTEMRPRPHGR